ncbi:MAG: DUF4388 domain-containing protein [Candidatus Hydrothermales bacterium]
MALVGDLRDIRIEDILKFIKRLSKSGKLIIDGKYLKGEIFFAKGMIVAVKKMDGTMLRENLENDVLELLRQDEGTFTLEPTQEEVESVSFLDPDEIILKI